MKKILIISPHFPPSNLAAVHRSRLFAQHLSDFGWEPVILTVDEKYYEENLDHNLTKLLPVELRIEKVNAFKVSKPRIIGDIGLRAFFQLYRRAKRLIKKENFDFLYIPIPSFYVALLGRLLHKSTGIKYGIDYIDPWVHTFPGSDKKFSRHWLSTLVSKFLEPIAVKKASLITGVAEGYYKGVIERNPGLLKKCVFGAMPYGGETEDHKKVKELGLQPYLFNKANGKIKLIYAGAMLPKAYVLLEEIFKSVKNNITLFDNVEFHFIGTGKTPDDKNGFNIKPVAEKYGISEKIIFEYPQRIPYLDVLVHLNIADGIFILGSTEPHYTPSKTYQGVMAEKPILAVLHKESSAVKVLQESKAGMVIGFNGPEETHLVNEMFPKVFSNYLSWMVNYDREQTDKRSFEQYSAKNVTGKLAQLLDEAFLIS